MTAKRSKFRITLLWYNSGICSLLVFTLIALILLLLSGSSAAASEYQEIRIVSSAPYSAIELEENTQVLIKYKQPELNDNDINAIFREVAPKIKTFDGRKYDKITANLMLESSTMIAQNTWSFEFLIVLEGIRDNKTESWRMDIELIKYGNKINITNIDGSGILVPNSYLELSKEIVIDKLDKKILSRTPENAGSRWLVDKNGSVVLNFKDPNGSATTDVTLDLNERRIVNIEKHYWGETFSLSIIEAFVDPQYNMGFYNSGDGLAIFLVFKTDTVYGCSNYKIIANTTKSADRIVVDIKGVQVEQYCDDTLGPAVFSKKLGDLKGEIDLVLKYEGEEDRYKLVVSDEAINITSLNSSFTHIDHPLLLLRIPKNVIWAECEHYDRIGCEENNESTSVCQKFFKELEELGAESFEPKNGTYAFAGFDRQNLRHFKYSGDASKLESLIKKYSINTNRSIENKENCTLLSISTWWGDWFYSWGEKTKAVQNQGTKGAQISGFELIAGIIALILVLIKRRY